MSDYNDGIEAAAKYIDKRRDAYVEEHGSFDPETGVTEFPGNGDEYVGELDEIAEGIRALKRPDAQASGWRTIESAPKDGTRILAMYEGEVRMVQWGKTSHVPLYGFCLSDQGPEDFDLVKIAHWQPLPVEAMVYSEDIVEARVREIARLLFRRFIIGPNADFDDLSNSTQEHWLAHARAIAALPASAPQPAADGEVLREVDREHIEACRSHLSDGARISVSGGMRLVTIIDRLVARLAATGAK